MFIYVIFITLLMIKLQTTCFSLPFIDFSAIAVTAQSVYHRLLKKCFLLCVCVCVLRGFFA